MSDDIKVVEKIDILDSIIINYLRWSYKDFIVFAKAATESQVKAYRKIQEIVVAWDYELDPLEHDALARLPYGEGARAFQRITELLNDALENAELEVTVDFMQGGWNTLIVEEFYEALLNHDYKNINRLVRQVCTVKGSKLGNVLTVIEGIKMTEAVKKRRDDIVSGKF